RGLAVGDLAHHRPDALLEIGAALVERDIEALEFAAKVAFKLTRCLFQNRRRFADSLLGGVRPAHGGQGLALRLERKTADRTVDEPDRHSVKRSVVAGILPTCDNQVSGEKG